MAENLVVGGNVKGDITSCKIENQVKSVDQGSILSVQKRTTYMTYDVCNKNAIATYTVPELTDFGGILAFVVTFTVIMGAALVCIHWLTNN